MPTDNTFIVKALSGCGNIGDRMLCPVEKRRGGINPGVSVVAGNDQKLRLPEFLDDFLATRRPSVTVTPSKELKEFMPSCSRGDRTRYFLKVQDGCDYFCSYCTIPFARGRSRSGQIDSLVEQAREAASEGGKEIVLTGVNIGDFGKGREDSFFDLIRRLDEVEGIERYRISSIEPNLLTDEIIEWVAESKRFMPHFHVPLQSGDDDVLALMRRHYDTSLFRSKMEKIRQVMPDAFIGVDLIVGAAARPGTFRELTEVCRVAADIPPARIPLQRTSRHTGLVHRAYSITRGQAQTHLGDVGHKRKEA